MLVVGLKKKEDDQSDHPLYKLKIKVII